MVKVARTVLREPWISNDLGLPDKPSMQWTQEQQPIIHSTADKLLVQASAGTGKTTTLIGYATHHASEKNLHNPLAARWANLPRHLAWRSENELAPHNR